MSLSKERHQPANDNDTNTHNNTNTSHFNDKDKDISLDIRDKHYIFQNIQTGKPSTTSFSADMLCRTVAAATAAAIATSTSASAATVSGHKPLFSLDTPIIEFNPLSNTYGSDGWKLIRDVPMLCAAASMWYYSVSATAVADGGDAGETLGPISCKELKRVVTESKDVAKIRVYNASNVKDGGKWKNVNDVLELTLVFNLLVETQLSFEEVNEGASKSENDKLDILFGNDKEEREDEDVDEEAFYSDGGTEYVKCKSTGVWLESEVVRSRQKSKGITPIVNERNIDAKKVGGIMSTGSLKETKKQKKRKRPKQFTAKKAKNWIYVTGLPPDTNNEEVALFFSRAGIIDLDPETQQPKIKLYRHKDKELSSGGVLKGDASICFARPESVDLALQILDSSMFRATSKHRISVTKAKFEQKGQYIKSNISLAKRKVAKTAALQAVCWDDSENGRLTGGVKGLRIIVLKNMFIPRELIKSDKNLEKLEKEIYEKCYSHGDVEKITVFSQNPDGIIIVKFSLPTAAIEAVNRFKNTYFDGRKIEASFWDGVTDYTFVDEVKEAAEMKKRHEDFGKWLDDQELPEHLRLRVEGE